MSHILFLENRHRTKVWEIIAAGLRDQGHTVSWLVMNHGFAPREGPARLLPYPRRQDLFPVEPRFAHIVAADRRIRYYGLTADHYVHYDREIRRALAELEPEIVIGEASQFYELLTVEACRDCGIRYIVPTSARYPTGRFVCCEFDTLDVVGGSGEVPSEEELSRFARQLARLDIVPDYMKLAGSGFGSNGAWKQWRDWAYKAFQYTRGERYCSPPPIKKLSERRTVQRGLERWDRLAQSVERMKSEKRLRVLFPLHKQPEASVDVWGRPYSDQPALIDAMAKAVGEDAVLFIKPNPKPGLELGATLLDMVAHGDGIVPLASGTMMREAFQNADLIVTVTGTVAIECIFARKPCATLIRSRNNDLAGCHYLASPAELGAVVREIGRGSLAMHDEQEVMKFAARLYAESYPGIVHDPFSEPELSSPQNRKLLVDAFGQLIPTLLSRSEERRLSCNGHRR